MSKPIRPGAKPLQIRASAWVHEVITKRTAVPGIEKWMVVENLMRAGLDSEAKPKASRHSGEPQPLDWRDPKNYHPIQLFIRVEHCLELFFANDVTSFMRTIRLMHDEKQPLPASAWKRWAKLQQIPDAYVPTLLKVLLVTDGISRTTDAYVSAKFRDQAKRRLLVTNS